MFMGVLVLATAFTVGVTYIKDTPNHISEHKVSKKIVKIWDERENADWSKLND